MAGIKNTIDTEFTTAAAGKNVDRADLSHIASGLKDEVKEALKGKKKKKETKEATGAGSAGAFVAPLTRKEETKEATGSASSGQYSTPAFVAKNKKNWRGAKKPMYPGGKFVEVKGKCKKFPYCNQGDIKALKLFENDTVKKVIEELSNEYGITEQTIKNILAKKFN